MQPPAGYINEQGYSVFLWIIGSAISLFASLHWLSVVYVDGQFIPWGNDSFYHARRILDTSANPAAFYQYDSMIHAPEGSWITWPWAYDYVIAIISRVLVNAGLADNYAQVLVLLPPVWALVNVALLLGISSVYRMSYLMRFVLVLCFALSPLTQGMHGAGRIDHHYMELTFVLAALLSLLIWARHPASLKFPVLTGAVLGLAPAVNNGLFILQLPVLLALTMMWMRSRGPTTRSSLAFAVTLLITTLTILLPSEPFMDMRFEYLLLSWFHLYVAMATGGISLFLSASRYGKKPAIVLAAAGAVLLVPLYPQLSHGLEFIAAGFIDYSEIPETRSIWAFINGQRGIYDGITYYSILFLVSPFVLLWGIYACFKWREDTRGILAVFSIFGLLMAYQQLRLHYFGTFAILIPPLLYVDHIVRSRKVKPWHAYGVASVVIFSLVPGIQQISRTPVMGGDINYELVSKVFKPFRDHCRSEPGIVLAERNFGNLLRYHTDCAVISNNMIMTAQHFEKIRQTNILLSLGPESIRLSRPKISYLLVVSNNKYGEQLKHRLLYSDKPVDGYERIAYVEVTGTGEERYPVAAAYKIAHHGSGAGVIGQEASRDE